MVNELRQGQVRTGVLIDGDEATPHLACTLTYESEQGALVEVAYVEGDPHFEVAQSWIKQRRIPSKALLFRDPDGSVTLAGVGWRGYRGGVGVAVGKLDARAAIFGMPRELADEYRVETLNSGIDGLAEFAGFESISTHTERVDGRWRTRATVHAKDEVSVSHRDFGYTIRATTTGSSTEGIEFTSRAGAAIETTVNDGATLEQHLIAQWPLRALLVVAHGVPLFWRSHHLVDEQFPSWILSGEARAPSRVSVLMQRTVSDHEQSAPHARDLVNPMFRLKDLTEENLLHWLELDSDPVFRRAVEPTVEVLNGAAGGFVEPRLTLTVFALEALGYYLDGKRTRNVPLWRRIARCLAVPGVDWSRMGEQSEIAKAIANVSNDMKHPDRGYQPDAVEMILAADLAMVVLRLQLALLLGVEAEVTEKFCQHRTFVDAVSAFDRNGVTINDGRFVRSPDTTP